jgi:predicted PurR-regulated permease PerM
MDIRAAEGGIAAAGIERPAENLDAASERADATGVPPDAAEPPPSVPTDPRTIFLGGLFGLALLAALYVAAAVVLPLLLAIVLKLLLQPFVRVLGRLGFPRALAAAVAIVLLVLVVAGLVSLLAGPGAHSAAKLPEAIPKIQEKLAFLQRPLRSAQWVVLQLQEAMGGGSTLSPPAQHANLIGVLFSSTATLAAQLFVMLVELFYLLVAGEIFLRRIVELIPGFGNKRQAVEISLHIEQDISMYLLTVTLINAAVGLATLGVMWICGVANPALWGTMAFVLNFVPILGPAVGIVIFLMASVLSLGVTWWALLPVGLYFCVHVLEGEFITPFIVARRFTINPVAIILSLVFWYWMWGVPGGVLAVPLLAIIKIVCDDLRPLRAFGHLLEA